MIISRRFGDSNGALFSALLTVCVALGLCAGVAARTSPSVKMSDYDSKSYTGEFVYKGCYKDVPKVQERALPFVTEVSPEMDHELCWLVCGTRGEYEDDAILFDVLLFIVVYCVKCAIFLFAHARIPILS